MTKVAACWIAVVPVLGIVALAQESGDPSSSEKSVTITGTVVNSATGQPIGGASVVLNAGFQIARFASAPDGTQQQQQQQAARRMSRPREEHQTVTDEGGNFSFEAVLGIGWSVSVSHRGYRAMGGLGDVATVRGMNQTRPDPLTVKLDALAVVEGKLVNEDGEALPSITVELWKIELHDGRRDVRRYATKVTDDLGAYRLWDLSPGSYYLKVAGHRGTALAAADTPQPSQFFEAYGPLYYPSSPDLQGARIIRLGGGESFHADFEVGAQQAYRVHGKFLNPVSARRVTLRLLRGDDEAGTRSGVNTSAGTFDVFDVVPGAYTLQAYTNDAGMALFGEIPISVGNGDVNGLSIAMGPAVSAEGKADSPESHKPGMLQVSANYSNARRLPPGIGPAVTAFGDADGRFKLEGLWPGHYEITVRPVDQRFVQSMTSGPIDVLADGLTVGSGAPEPLKLALTDGAGTIHANMSEDETEKESMFVGAMPKSGTPGTLVVYPFIGASMPRNTGTPVTSFPGSAGNPNGVTFFGLAPGDYSVIAWSGAQEWEYRNPAVLAVMSAYGVSVSVGRGETKEVTFKLIPKGVN